MCSVSINGTIKDLKRHVRVGNVGTRMAEDKQGTWLLGREFLRVQITIVLGPLVLKDCSFILVSTGMNRWTTHPVA